MAFLTEAANRGSISTGYDVDNSLKLEQDNTEYLHKTPGSSGNRRTFTLSAWIKRTEITRGSGGGDYIFQAGDGDYNQNDRTLIKFNHDDTLYFGGGSAYLIKTNRVFRDTSAWYHIAMIVDTTDGTAGDRLKLYINGVRETDLATNTNPDQNFQFAFMKDDKHVIGYNHTDSSNPASMYITEVVWLDGTAASITDLGKFDSNGIWVPIDVSSLSVGTNGCYLDFEDSSNLGNDASGGTDFTLNNITAADQSTDTCTNNFCTWSPLWTFPIARTLTEGLTKVTGSSAWGGVKGSIGVTNGKWYWENKTSGNDTIIGWQTDNVTPPSGTNAHNIIDTVALYQDGNYIWIKDSTSGRNDTTASGTNASGQIIGFALDLDSSPQTATFYRNGSAIASDVNIDGATGKTLFPMMAQYNQNAETNFGGFTTFSISSAETDDNGYGTFEYAPPSGYYALCSKNLAEFG